MGLSEDLRKEIEAIFREKWEVREGAVIPSDTSLKLSNDGIKIKGAVLYADLVGSTAMVDTKNFEFAAEVYKAFLRCSCKIITSMGGEITAFDGDRVMAVFIGDSKNTSAVTTGLKINWGVKNIVIPALKSVYTTSDFTVKHCVGIDTGEMLVAKTGIRGSNDLVWVGPPANYAAKLSTLREEGYSTWISQGVFDNCHKDAKYSGDKLMWESRVWNGKTVYRSSYWWSL